MAAVSSSRNKRKFVDDENGFVYVFDTRSKKDEVTEFWRCERKGDCKGRIWVSGYETGQSCRASPDTRTFLLRYTGLTSSFLWYLLSLNMGDWAGIPLGLSLFLVCVAARRTLCSDFCPKYVRRPIGLINDKGGW